MPFLLDDHTDLLKPEEKDNLVMVDVVELTRYFYQVNPKSFYSYETDFPNVTPSWTRCWFEWKQPAFTIHGGKEVPHPARNVIDRWGCWIERLPAQPKHMIREEFERAAAKNKQTMDMSKFPDLSGVDLPWQVFLKLYGTFSDTGQCLFLFDILDYLQPSGLPFINLRTAGYSTEVMPNISLQEVFDIPPMFMPVWYALSLLNCKNVSTLPNPPGEKRQRKRRKRRKPPLNTYHRLIIKGMSAKESKKLGSNSGTVMTGEHIVRGHFKDYRKGNGLFGKLHGLFFWEQTMRGNPEYGKIQKDYEIRP